MKRLIQILQAPSGVILVLLLGVFGILLTELPDMFPDSDLVSVPPHLASLDAGFSDLTRFDSVDANDNPISILHCGEEGYKAIYNLLRTFDPSIPILEDITTDSQTRAIVTTEAIKWNNPHGEMPVFRPVMLYFEELGNNPVPICDMRDLAFLIRDCKVSFWSGTGSALAFVALLLQTVPALTRVTEPVQQDLTETQIQPVSDNYGGDIILKKEPINIYSDQNAASFLIVLSLCVVFIVILILRLKKQTGCFL